MSVEIRNARADVLDDVVAEMVAMNLCGLTALTIQDWLRQRARLERLGDVDKPPA